MNLRFTNAARITVLTIFVSLVFGTISMFAQMNVNTGSSTLVGDDRENGRKLEGVWTVTVTTVDCVTGAPSRSFPALETYARGGTMIEFATGAATSATPTDRTTAQGSWGYDSNGIYTTTYVSFRFNADRTLAGTQKVTAAVIELNDDGDSFTSDRTAQGFNTAGVLTATRCSTQVATRLE